MRGQCAAASLLCRPRDSPAVACAVRAPCQRPGCPGASPAARHHRRSLRLVFLCRFPLRRGHQLAQLIEGGVHGALGALRRLRGALQRRRAGTELRQRLLCSHADGALRQRIAPCNQTPSSTRTVLGARAVQRFTVERVDARPCAARDAGGTRASALLPPPQRGAPARPGARTQLELVLRHRHAAHDDRRARGKRRARRAASAAAPPAAPPVCGVRCAAAASAPRHTAALALVKSTREAGTPRASWRAALRRALAALLVRRLAVHALLRVRARGDKRQRTRCLCAPCIGCHRQRTSSSSPSTTAPAGAAYMAAAQLRRTRSGKEQAQRD